MKYLTIRSMNNNRWILFDLQSTGGISQSVVIELAAQRMKGWQSDGAPYRSLISPNANVIANATLPLGYTSETLERDGEPPLQVHREFAAYVGGLPLVSFNLEYHLDEVLTPEWRRLHMPPIGSRGFCALRLTQRLLDPLPVGNCSLETLQQYYGLPERGMHRALAGVQTVADLLFQVIRPLAEQRGLDTWEKLTTYADDEWYPSRIAFGKHKGRLIQEARKDGPLRDWLHRLAESPNTRNSKMGRWYLHQLESNAQPEANYVLFPAPQARCWGDGAARLGGDELHELILYVNPELAELRQSVANARAHLAKLEAEYTTEKSRIDAMQAILFGRLREHYQKRDGLRLIVDFRKKYLNSLVRGGEAEAGQTEAQYQRAKSQTDRDYEEAAAAVTKKKQLSAAEEAELTRLWKKLVKLYHPDRFAHEPDKLETYHKLTSAINRAKDAGDMETLREIAEDPHGFILRQGWASLDFSDEVQLLQLRRLHETLQLEILVALESLNQLRKSPDHALCIITKQEPGVLDKLVQERKALLDRECSELEGEADRLSREISELTGTCPVG